MIPPALMKLAAERGVESGALNPKAGDIPTFTDKAFSEVGSEVPSFEKDPNIPKFAEADGETFAEDNAGEDGETTSSESETVADEVDVNLDARVDDVASDSERKGDVSEERKTGGTYGALKKEWSGELETPPPHEVHHMPANDVNGLKENDGPAIVMEKSDHRQTASCGNSREAREYRQKQKELIDEGKFEEAMQMDIDDIHDKFGDKYDEAIAQMKETAKEKGLI